MRRRWRARSSPLSWKGSRPARRGAAGPTDRAGRSRLRRAEARGLGGSGVSTGTREVVGQEVVAECPGGVEPLGQPLEVGVVAVQLPECAGRGGEDLAPVRPGAEG